MCETCFGVTEVREAGSACRATQLRPPAVEHRRKRSARHASYFATIAVGAVVGRPKRPMPFLHVQLTVTRRQKAASHVFWQDVPKLQPPMGPY